jgi:phosphate starvation-inducible PhoH-like protein
MSLNFNEKQESYRKALHNDDTSLVISIGPAGTGKTLVACQEGLTHLKQKSMRKMIVTRPTISVGRDIGYLPGEIESKMHPWLIPIYDNLNLNGDDKQQKGVKSSMIEICPLSFIRGRTFHDAYVIADEMQNSTVIEMKTLLTRIGKNSKLVITGDLDQCDLNVETNGLQDLISKLRTQQTHPNNNEPLIKLIEFDVDDVQRSALVKQILKLYTN